MAAYLIGQSQAGYTAGVTMAFCVLAISQLFHSLNQRSNVESVFHASTHNRSLFWAMTASAVILAAIVFLPPLRSFFKLTTLSLAQWGVTLLFSLVPLLLVELSKGMVRLKRHVK